MTAPKRINNDEHQALGAYIEHNRDFLDRCLLDHGAVLFKGFAPKNTEEFEAAVTKYSCDLMEHSERLTKRKHLSGGINSTTEYDPTHKILLHTENSFAFQWPRKMFFFCIVPAATGGETPLADVRAVYQNLDHAIRDKFERLGVKYVRNYWDGFGPNWHRVYGVETKSDLEEYCRVRGATVEWPEANRPRVSQTWPAVVNHPDSGEKVWFNHATTSNVESVIPALKGVITNGFRKEDYPNNSYYGDGTDIEPEVLAAINRVYDDLEVKAPWHAGDVLLVDNMRIAHGRNPFTGDREIAVAMLDAMDRDSGIS